MVPLGPFDLLDRAASGGMGSVYRAVHRERQVPVAVKVLTSELARDERFAMALRDEVRAVAALDHPNVVTVFDQGVITHLVERETSGELIAGSPYLVMEWASGGTLATRGLPASWAELRVILLALLDALAHAHARGVVHRDIKPANVLLCDAIDLRPGPKLADFGIARPRDRESAHDPVGMGTIAYMAPEQILGESRDEGPWTDLYALGCLVFRLATGQAPYRGSMDDVVAAHLDQPIPLLHASFAVPEGADAWIGHLMAKDPGARYQQAADAAFALRALGDPDPGAVATKPARSVDPDAPTSVTVIDTPLPTLSWTHVELETHTAAVVFGRPASARHDAQRPRAAVVPFVPESWRRASDEPLRSMKLVGTGLGLFGMRTIPLVDREGERDLLWSELARARGDGEPRLVLVEGPTGFGKSRLCEWLAERANELGAATRLKAVHDPGGGSAHGLGAMLGRWLRCHGLDHEAIVARIERVLRPRGLVEPDDWLALAELIAPRDESHEGRRIQFVSPRERYALVARVLEVLTSERPLVLWLDDAQWGADALAFVQHLLERNARGRLPVLVLAALRSELLADRPVERDLTTALRSHARTTAIEIGPLPPRDANALVREMLLLDGEVAARIEERVAGNPAFAVHLVGDWIERGLLELGDRGFRLRQGASLDLPEDLHQVWRAAVEDLVASRDASEVVALEIAATLGIVVDRTEWEAACAQSGVRASDALLGELLDRRYARTSTAGTSEAWTFAHGMLREALVRRAESGGRARAHHRACAKMLRGRHDDDSATALARLGRHLVAAGDAAEAIEPLLESAEKLHESGEVRVADTVLTDCDAAMRACELPEHDPRWGQLLAMRAASMAAQAHLDKAEALAAELVDRAAKHGWVRPWVRAIEVLARVYLRRGEAEKTISVSRDAMDRLDEDALFERGRLLLWVGIGHCERQELERARECQSRAFEVFEALGREQDAAEALYELALVAEGRNQQVELLRRAREAFLRMGRRNAAANCLTAIGSRAREDGDLDEAARCAREAMAMYESLGSGNALVARLNLGLVLLQQERWGDARPVLEDARAGLASAGWMSLVACAHVELLPVHAEARDWEAWDRDWAAAQKALEGTSFFDPDLAWAARLAGERAAAAGELGRAHALWALAVAQYEGCGNPDEARALAARLTSST